MSTLETRSYMNKKPIDIQWVRENEANETYKNTNYKNDNTSKEDIKELEETMIFLEAIKALKDEDLENLRTASENLKKIDKEENQSFYFDDEYLFGSEFVSEEEREEELKRIMG